MNKKKRKKKKMLQSSLLTKLKALANSKRLEIVHILSDGAEHTVTEIKDILGFPLSTVARHIEKLEKAGIVSKHVDGRYVHCVLKKRSLMSLLNLLVG